MHPAIAGANGPITQTALFEPGHYPLTMIAGEGGTVTPHSGSSQTRSQIQIEAIPDSLHLFKEWVGEGEGSFSGNQAVATITMNGPIILLDGSPHSTAPG